jgi:hypothetical protein
VGTNKTNHAAIKRNRESSNIQVMESAKLQAVDINMSFRVLTFILNKNAKQSSQSANGHNNGDASYTAVTYF